MNSYYFTTHVRSVLQKARIESAALNHEYVGTEHILLALVTEVDSIALGVLKSLAVDAQAIRAMLLDMVKKGKPRADVTSEPDLPYTSRAKKVLELAMSEARDLGHNYVGTEHLLLGLVREEKGIAAQVLADRGVALDAARRDVLRLTRERGTPPVRGEIDPADPPAETPGRVADFVVARMTPHTPGDTVLRVTLAGVSIVAGAATLVRLFTSGGVISWYAGLLSGIELVGGALLLNRRTMRIGGWILLGVFTIAIVTRLAQGTFPGPVIVQAATTFYLLTRGRMSFRTYENPGT